MEIDDRHAANIPVQVIPDPKSRKANGSEIG